MTPLRKSYYYTVKLTAFIVAFFACALSFLSALIITANMVILVTSSPSCAVLRTSQISLALFNPAPCCTPLDTRKRGV
jgi:hypothetical protein